MSAVYDDGDGTVKNVDTMSGIGTVGTRCVAELSGGPSETVSKLFPATNTGTFERRLYGNYRCVDC